MEFIGSILSEAIKDGRLSTESLLMLLNGLVIAAYMMVVRPIKEKIDTLPSIVDVKDIIDETNKIDKVRLDEIAARLDKIVKDIDEIHGLDEDTYREIINMRRDVETVKQILNQFQGHMMYGRRSGDFGNKELR